MNKKILKSVMMRSFLIQGTWNFERMQNLGFCYALLPALKYLYGKDEKIREPVKRHLEFFNTHPYMAAPVIGAAVKMEEEVARGGMKGEDINTFKAGVMGSYGAIGDSFFWGTLKPFASLIAVFSSLLDQVFSPLIFLILYNVSHLRLRIEGFYMGYEEGVGVIDGMKRFNFFNIMKKIKTLTVIAAGALLAVYVSTKPVTDFNQSELLGALVAAALFGLYYRALKWGLTPQLLIYTSLVITVGLSAFI